MERQNQTVVAMARALMKQRNLTARFCRGGRGDRGSLHEPGGHQELAGQDTLRGVARQGADGVAPAHV